MAGMATPPIRSPSFLGSLWDMLNSNSLVGCGSFFVPPFSMYMSFGLTPFLW